MIDVLGGISQAPLFPFLPNINAEKMLHFNYIRSNNIFGDANSLFNAVLILMWYSFYDVSFPICFIQSSAVNQPYETRVSDEFVMEGNDAIVKCSLPSFAADFLEVISWSSDETVYIKKSNFHGNNSSL